MLLSTSSTSLTEQLTVRLAERIKAQRLAPGTRPPSVRRYAGAPWFAAATLQIRMPVMPWVTE